MLIRKPETIIPCCLHLTNINIKIVLKDLNPYFSVFEDSDIEVVSLVL